MVKSVKWRFKLGDCYIFIKYELETNRVGYDDTVVVEFDDNVTEEYIEEYGNDLARDNADMYGIIIDAEEEAKENGFEVEYSDVYWASYEILDIPREEIEECCGSITNVGC